MSEPTEPGISAEARLAGLRRVIEVDRTDLLGALAATLAESIEATAVCHWCQKFCGGTCLGLTSSTQMRTDDPAYSLLNDGHTSTPVVYREDCYICRDPEFAQMGLSLCRKCPACGGHVAADDSVCDDCGADDGPDYGPDDGEPVVVESGPAVEAGPSDPPLAWPLDLSPF